MSENALFPETSHDRQLYLVSVFVKLIANNSTINKLIVSLAVLEVHKVLNDLDETSKRRVDILHFFLVRIHTAFFQGFG